MTDLIFSF